MEEKRSAYHEAGHAVASHVLDRGTVYSITMEPDLVEGTRAATRGDWGMSMEPTTQELEDEIVVLYAGCAAEARFDSSRAEQARLGAVGDEQQASDWLRWLEDGAAAEGRLRQRAVDLVNEHFDKIEVLESDNM